MAIYQFYMAVIPKQGILEYLGNIPNRLIYDAKNANNNDSDGEIEDEFDYFEFIQHECWNLTNIPPNRIIEILDTIIARANWGNDEESYKWQQEHDDIDIDAWILINETSNRIVEFSFRADLRDPTLQFLKEMIKIADANDFLMIDYNGNIVEPEMKNIIELIKQSNAYRFLDNPTKYFEDLDNNRIDQ